MIIYKDLISGDELCSDSFECSEVEGCLLEVVTKVIQKTEGGEEIAGVDNTESAADRDGAQTISVNNLVDAMRLQPTAFGKKDYTLFIKGYMKDVKEKLEKESTPDEVKAFMKSASGAVKSILANFDNYTFYTGESMDPKGMVALQFYKEDQVIPYFWFWKHGLIKEKV